MLDVHPPHQIAHTWKDFFIHVGTITVGLLIAVGLEQSVAAVHHRHLQDQLEDDLRAEMLRNRDAGVFNLAYSDRNLSWLLELRVRVYQVRRGADKVSFIYPSSPTGYPGDPNHTDRRPPSAGVWNAASQSGLVGLLPREQQQMYQVFYLISEHYTDEFNLQNREWQKLRSFEAQFAEGRLLGPPRVQFMTAAQLDQYAAIISDVIMETQSVKRWLQVQMAWNDAAIELRSMPNIEQYFQTHPDPLPDHYVESGPATL